MMARTLAWGGLLSALASIATASGCGGQATSRGQEASKCGPGTTKCGVPDAGDPPPAPGSGGARSTGGRDGSGGAPAFGGSAGSSGATSADASAGTGGVPTRPDSGNVGDAQGPRYDTGPSGDTTPPTFAGCKLVYDVGYETLRVSWDAATDDATAASSIVYEIWVRPLGSTGDPRSVAATKTVVGVTFADVEGLIPGTEYEILCGAKDASRNRDAGQKPLSTRTQADGTPPVFAGLATVEGLSRHTVRLSWTPANDNASTGSEIVYAVYAADVARTEDFATPKLLTGPGETSVIVSGLFGGQQYFVVRARDRAGNEDANLFERSVTLTLPTSFELDVQPIFTANCAVTVCHWPGADGTNPPIEGLDLAEGAAYTNIVNVVAHEGVMISPPEPNLKRIDASSTNPMDSYLWRKLQKPALPNIFGNTEPVPQAQRTLTSEQIQIITEWITEGALNN